MQGPFLRKYGVGATFNFTLFEVDGVDFRTDAVHAAGDTVVMKDEGAETSTTNGFVDEGKGYSITLTATEMQAARIVVYVVDLTATKAWLDTAIVIDTYGHASAQHAIDLDDAVRAGMTALPNAAADAAGGLPISDTGGLDLDALNTAAVRLTAARAQAIDDWIDAGRLDALLDAIKAKTDNLPTDPADDSDIDTQLATIAAYLDTEVAAILADTNELQTDWADGGRLDLILDAATTAGAGAIEFTYTLTSTGAGTPPIDGATVWCTTDEAGTNTVASGTTDSFGEVTFYLDAGTYYFWRQASGWTFDNPDTEAVS